MIDICAAKIVLTSPRLITRVKKNNGEWCPAILGRHPLLNKGAFEAREEQLDCFCDANGGALEDAELRGLVRTIIYLESIKPTTCSIEQKVKQEYDRELEDTTVPAEFCVGSKALLKYMNMFAPIVLHKTLWASRRRTKAANDPRSHFTFACAASVATGNYPTPRTPSPVCSSRFLNVDATQRLITPKSDAKVKARSTRKTAKRRRKTKQSCQPQGKANAEASLFIRIKMHATVFKTQRRTIPLKNFNCVVFGVVVVECMMHILSLYRTTQLVLK